MAAAFLKLPLIQFMGAVLELLLYGPPRVLYMSHDILNARFLQVSTSSCSAAPCGSCVRADRGRRAGPWVPSLTSAPGSFLSRSLS
jgi:hypothetical protein